VGTLFKVLKKSRACSGGDFDYRSYIDNKEAWTPPIEKPQACATGYHLTTQPWKWYQEGAVVYQAEGRGAHDVLANKIAYESIRILDEWSYFNGAFRRLEECISLYQDAPIVEINDRSSITITDKLTGDTYRDLHRWLRWSQELDSYDAVHDVVSDWLEREAESTSVTYEWLITLSFLLYINGYDSARIVMSRIKSFIAHVGFEKPYALIGTGYDFTTFVLAEV